VMARNGAARCANKVMVAPAKINEAISARFISFFEGILLSMR